MRGGPIPLKQVRCLFTGRADGALPGCFFFAVEEPFPEPISTANAAKIPQGTHCCRPTRLPDGSGHDMSASPHVAIAKPILRGPWAGAQIPCGCGRTGG